MIYYAEIARRRQAEMTESLYWCVVIVIIVFFLQKAESLSKRQ